MQTSSASHRPTPVWPRHENASRGSSGTGADRLSRSIAASATIAAAIRATFDSDEATTEASDVAAIARQIRPTRPAGIREDGVRPAVGGRMNNAAMARAPAARAVATNAARQLTNSAKIPPTSGPISTDTLQLVDIKAMVRDHTDCGKVERTST